MKNNVTRQKVMDAACQLFYAKGYHGTSVRDIAKKADVNVSLINYYFNSKQGLLESAVVTYYESYLKELEAITQQTEQSPSLERLKQMVSFIIQYKQKRHQFTCFIQRELTIDSVFVRELMVTYLAKENHLIKSVFEKAVEGTNHSEIDRQFFLLQLKGLLITPQMTANEWREQVTWDQSQDLFITRYSHTVHQWLDFVTKKREEG
ncbi:forespore capture DNA-binding protein RefZ [Radiobacillus kanasensis]|uniref:forespore capture DNA-binding protein RefZ n=1 Tax=Radiobacillus kanasensis TaxID=2844358 RepID=UPI001E60BF21|nr:forespore capture DNA-binding protein RefZ [Radiobacillus kanasensis]UFT98041.1 forespore capture DNA-binding protein RefZ [Radiobacillus kanasensis]